MAFVNSYSAKNNPATCIAFIFIPFTFEKYLISIARQRGIDFYTRWDNLTLLIISQNLLKNYFMKTNLTLGIAILLFSVMGTNCASSQKYKTAADTLKLNKEYADVNKDVADLNAKLIEAQNELPKLQSKAVSESAQAQEATNESTRQAMKSDPGDLGDAKKAKKKANKAVDEAKDAEKAQNRVNDQNKKIEKLQSQLEKKQKRLQELETMRTNIAGSMGQTLQQ